MNGSGVTQTLDISLIKELCREEKENFVISPLSLGMDLAMWTAGLRGENKTQLLNLLGETDENKRLSMYSTLLTEEGLPL